MVSITTRDFDFSGLAYESEGQERTSAKAWFEKKGFYVQEAPLYLSPSRVEANSHAAITIVEELDYRMGVKGGVENHTLGALVHNALYVMDNADFPVLVQRLLERAQAQLSICKEDILAMREKVKAFIDAYTPVKVHHELFMVKKKDNGHVLKGEADLIIEREHDLLLVDYKTYEGPKAQYMDAESDFYAGKFAGQLEAYKEMEEHVFNKPVAGTYIFYVMQGVVVDMQV